jgi:hypothetical protein
MTTVVQERVALAIASIVAAVAIAAAAAGVPGSDDALLTVATTAPAIVSPASTSPPAAVSAQPQTSAAVPAPATAAPAPAGGPGETVPSKPGTYRYREVSDGETTEETVRITDRGGGRQTEAETDFSNEVAWRPDGKYILESTFGQPPQGFRCDWNPDVLEYKLPLAQGTTWQAAQSCTPGQGFTIEFESTSRVTGAERIRVAGQDVDTWVIRSEGTLTFRTPQGSSTQNLTSDSRFSPKHGLSVKSTETIKGRDPSTGENVDETSTREILNLTPA